MPNLNIPIDQALHAKLTDRARRNGQSLAAFVRAECTRIVGRPDDMPPVPTEWIKPPYRQAHQINFRLSDKLYQEAARIARDGRTTVGQLSFIAMMELMANGAPPQGWAALEREVVREVLAQIAERENFEHREFS